MAVFYFAIQKGDFLNWWRTEYKVNRAGALLHTENWQDCWPKGKYPKNANAAKQQKNMRPEDVG